MMNFKKYCLLVILIGMLNGICFGKDISHEVMVLTLKDALAIASEKNKDIALAKEYRNMVYGRYIEERAAAYPRLSLSGTGMLNRDETLDVMGSAPLEQEAISAKVKLQQVLYAWGQVGAAIRAAEIGLKTADDQLRLYRQTVARDVCTAFFDILLAKELLEISRQNYDQKIRHLEESKKKYIAGTATDYDILSADVAVKNARPEVIQAENRLDIFKERLSILLGFNSDRFEVSGTLQSDVSSFPNFQTALETALANRPELSELNHRVGVQKELIKVYSAGDKPRIDFEASYGWQTITIDDHNDQGQVASGAIVISYPFFDGMRTRGKVVQAKSDLMTLYLQEEKLKDTIRLQVSEAISALKESGEIVGALIGMVSQAEKLLEMAEKGFVYGVKTHLDVQDAQLALKQAKGNLARAKRDYMAAKVHLDWVMGVDITGEGN